MTKNDAPPDGFPLVVTATTPGLEDNILSTIHYWILSDRIPTKVTLGDSLKHMLEADADPSLYRVDETLVGEARVSTVFVPQLAFQDRISFMNYHFETMIFGGSHDQRTVRYLTWDEAQAGHDEVVAMLIDGLPTTV